MSKINYPKHTADLDEIIPALKIYYDANGDWVTNADYKQKLKMLIGDGQYDSSYLKKSQNLYYFGFVEWNPALESERRITSRGRIFYEHFVAGEQDKVFEDLMIALEEMTFGRDNKGGFSSDTDVEAPGLLIRAILDLGYITLTEFAYFTWQLVNNNASYTETKDEILAARNGTPLAIPDSKQFKSIYKDPKFDLVMTRLGFLCEETIEGIGKVKKINPAVLEKYGSRLKNLKIYSVDKSVPIEENHGNQNGDDVLMVENSVQKKDYTIDELGEILAEMYANANSKTTAIHMFAIKYGKAIKASGASANSIVTAAKLNDSYSTEISKGLRIYDSLCTNEYSVKFYEGEDKANTYALDDPRRVKGGVNVLLYGVPGCGKSHEIKTKYCSDKKYMERVVFHPDYTYSDFVGQILPKTDGTTISYPFTEGPFTTILRKAIRDPEHMYYLVIEEINRGNAPAIFGEVFQLLDREDGTSEYGINNFDIAKCVYGAGMEEEEIKIPSNLTILATMNTADQNVFTLDTAFKRRWSMRNIENNISACKHANNQICGTAVTWGFFATKINNLIIDIGEGNLSSEDNRLGAYFVKAEDLQDTQSFAEKVLMYLWNDAFKYDHDKVFKPEYRTLEELLKGFYTHKFGIFVSQLGFADITVAGLATGDLSEDEYLVNKTPELVDLYKTIRDMVQLQVPNLTTYTTASKAYIGMGSEDNKKKNFAEFSIRKGQLSLEVEKPDDAVLQTLGEEIPYNGSHDHYFGISVTAESNLDLVVAAIVASYEKLKQG